MSLNTPKNFKIVKKQWLKANPPDRDGNYMCWICNRPVLADKVSLDHVAPVELYPEYAKELSNLRPSHEFCNQQRAVPVHSKIVSRFGRHKNRHKGYVGIKP
jgi:5-methylcytosine-specific restriction endonuclease McrA